MYSLFLKKLSESAIFAGKLSFETSLPAAKDLDLDLSGAQSNS